MSFDVNDITKKVTADIKDISEVQFRVLTFKVARDIILGTPVLEGTARASWNISKGAKDSSSRPADKNRSVGVNDVPKNPKLKPYYISSPIPYMNKLEFGHSQKNQGFIRAALVRYDLI